MAALEASQLRLDDVAPAEEAGLLTIEGGAVFAHPVVPVCVIDHSPAALVSATARALASIVDSPTLSAQLLERWIDAGDDDIADAWQAAASASSGRGAHEHAGDCWQRVGDRASEPQKVTDALANAAQCFINGGAFAKAAAILDRQILRTDELVATLPMLARKAQVDTWLHIGEFDAPSASTLQRWIDADEGSAAVLMSCLATQAFTAGRMPEAFELARLARATHGGDPGVIFTEEMLGFVNGREPTLLLTVAWEDMLDDRAVGQC